MSIEERLSRDLHSSLDAAEPSRDLEARILDRVVVSRRRGTNLRIRVGIGGAIVIVLAVALLPILASQIDRVGVPSQQSSATSSAPAVLPSAASSSSNASLQLAYFKKYGVSFDYPSSWADVVAGVVERYSTTLDYLGTASGLSTCVPTAAPTGIPSVSSPCQAYASVGPGQVAVELIKDEGPFYSKGPIDPSDPSGLSSGSSYVMVGGLPAIYAESGGTSSDPTLTLDWTLSVPDNIFARHTIEAKIHGPGLDELKAQVESMVASLRFDPPVSSPNAGDVTKIVASGLDQAAVKDPGYACFPRKQATGATARVAALPGTRLSQPLEVTCSAGIQPFESWLWKVTLTVSWAPASDHTGGSYVTILWLAADGTLRGTYSPQGQSAIPYAQ